MKKHLLLALAAIVLCFVACNKEADEPTPTPSEPVAVTGVSLNKTMVVLEIGESVTVEATVTPETAVNKEVKWSIANTAIATVTDGVVTAVAEGETTLTVTTDDGGHTATIPVKVVTGKVAVTGVSLNKTMVALEIGESVTVEATVTPETADNKEVKWSIANTAIATVTDGVVTAVAEGETTLTVTTDDGGHTATIPVVVTEKVAVTGVSLNKTMVTLEIGESVTVEATVTPETADNKEVKWSIANTAIATVIDGVVTGVAAGETTLTVTTVDGGHTATIPVKVVTEKVAVTGIRMSTNSSIEIKESQESMCIVEVLPANATDVSVKWSSSDEKVATVTPYLVNQNAVAVYIKGVGGGTAIITATTNDGGFKAYCEITVLQKVTEIKIGPENATIGAGQTQQFKATILPSDADNKEVEWSSSDTAVATVDANGLVTGVAEGEATITATAKDGSGVTGTAKVTVVIIPTSVTFNGKTGLSEENIFLTWHGKVVDLKATIEPKEASLKTLLWDLNGATYDCSPVWDYDITDDKATISVVIPEDEQSPQDVRTTVVAKLSENSMPLAKATIVSRCCFWCYRSFSDGNISNEGDILHFGPQFYHKNEYFRWDATGDRKFANGWYFVAFCPPISESLTNSSALYYKESYIPADEYTLTSTSKNIKITKMENVCYKVERTKWDAYEEFTLTYTCGEYVYNIPCRLIP